MGGGGGGGGSGSGGGGGGGGGGAGNGGEIEHAGEGELGHTAQPADLHVYGIEDVDSEKVDAEWKKQEWEENAKEKVAAAASAAAAAAAAAGRDNGKSPPAFVTDTAGQHYVVQPYRHGSHDDDDVATSKDVDGATDKWTDDGSSESGHVTRRLTECYFQYAQQTSTTTYFLVYETQGCGE